MLHERLNLTRDLFVLDCETTGVDSLKDRIVELGFQQWTPKGMVNEWSTRINPEILIPEAVAKIHGIYDKDVQDCQPFKYFADNLIVGFSNCDFAGKNVRFDLRFLTAEMLRAGKEWSYAKARIIDAERLEQVAVPRTLSHLYKKYTGKNHDGAHGALSDVQASAIVITEQLASNTKLPSDLDELHELQWPGRIDPEGKFQIVGEYAICKFGKWKGSKLQDIPRHYWNWILKADFSVEVKTIARDAIIGKFPEGVRERKGDASEF